MSELVQLAPTILGFLGGPAGGLAGAGLQWLAGKFGASAPTVDAIKSALDGFKPEDAIAMRKLDIEFQEFCMANQIQVQLAQIAVNTEEAKSGSWFTSGWRPATGWICSFALAYSAIIEPLARFIASVGFGYSGPFPIIDTNITMQVLFGLLGLGAYRTVEKVKNASEK